MIKIEPAAKPPEKIVLTLKVTLPWSVGAVIPQVSEVQLARILRDMYPGLELKDGLDLSKAIHAFHKERGKL